MKPTLLLITLLLLPFCRVNSQNPSKPFGVRFSGFVKTDILYDTRQSSASNGIREGHFYLYPDDVAFSADSVDINASPSFHILNIQTRFRADLTGPDAFGAKTSGAIEAEFFGTSEADLNGFRLRHAFTRLDWKRTTLMIGQYWNPIFPDECYPGTISFNTGAPFTPFARNPQIRITRRAGSLTAILTAYSERDFVSTGPDGVSNKYMRNSGMPALNLQFRIPVARIGLLFAGADFRRIRPQLKTAANYSTRQTLNSFSGFVTLNIKTKPVTFTAMGAWIRNATDLTMIGGYAIDDILDPEKYRVSYTNLSTLGTWFDLTTNGEKLKAGLFGGYERNFGAGTPVYYLYGRGTNIAFLYRISPRVSFISGKTTFAAEWETTTAAYGNAGVDGKVTDAHPVTNVRLLGAVYYKF
jgi:hypothetical protein